MKSAVGDEKRRGNDGKGGFGKACFRHDFLNDRGKIDARDVAGKIGQRQQPCQLPSRKCLFHNFSKIVIGGVGVLNNLYFITIGRPRQSFSKDIFQYPLVKCGEIW